MEIQTGDESFFKLRRNYVGNSFCKGVQKTEFSRLCLLRDVLKFVKIASIHHFKHIVTTETTALSWLPCLLLTHIFLFYCCLICHFILHRRKLTGWRVLAGCMTNNASLDGFDQNNVNITCNITTKIDCTLCADK